MFCSVFPIIKLCSFLELSRSQLHLSYNENIWARFPRLVSHLILSFYIGCASLNPVSLYGPKRLFPQDHFTNSSHRLSLWHSSWDNDVVISHSFNKHSLRNRDKLGFWEYSNEPDLCSQGSYILKKTKTTISNLNTMVSTMIGECSLMAH